MNHAVYIVYNDSIAKYYVGQTENLSRRLAEHNAGKGNYTSKGALWRLIHCFECVNRVEAIRLEKTIKSRGIKRYLHDNNLAENNLGM